MNIGEKAFAELFPEKDLKRITIKYSKAFQPYNGNVKYTSKKIEFGFSHVWQGVSEEIQVGLAQHLLLKIYKSKKRTVNIDLYEKFLEKVTKYAQAEEVEWHPELDASFDRVNKQYFHDFMEKPKLEWGSLSTAQLGTYSYHTDTIRISTLFKNLDAEETWMLDYIMYHELLHKKLGLRHKDGNCRHHPPAFKALERKFVVKDAEKKLTSFIRSCKRGGKKQGWGFMRNIFK